VTRGIVTVESRDRSRRVDVAGLGVCGARGIDRGESAALVPQEAATKGGASFDSHAGFAMTASFDPK
jgi:hypothetical protein